MQRQPPEEVWQLEPRYQAELAHALCHLSLLALLRRVTGTRRVPLQPTTTTKEER